MGGRGAIFRGLLTAVGVLAKIGGVADDQNSYLDTTDRSQKLLVLI